MARAPQRRPGPPGCCGRLSEKRIPDVREFISPIILVHWDLWIELSNMQRFFHPSADPDAFSVDDAYIFNSTQYHHLLTTTATGYVLKQLSNHSLMRSAEVQMKDLEVS